MLCFLHELVRQTPTVHAPYVSPEPKTTERNSFVARLKNPEDSALASFSGVLSSFSYDRDGIPAGCKMYPSDGHPRWPHFLSSPHLTRNPNSPIPQPSPAEKTGGKQNHPQNRPSFHRISLFKPATRIPRSVLRHSCSRSRWDAFPSKSPDVPQSPPRN